LREESRQRGHSREKDKAETEWRRDVGIYFVVFLLVVFKVLSSGGPEERKILNLSYLHIDPKISQH